MSKNSQKRGKNRLFNFRNITAFETTTSTTNTTTTITTSTTTQLNTTTSHMNENIIFNETYYIPQVNTSDLLTTVEINFFDEISNNSTATTTEITFLNHELLKDLTTVSLIEHTTTAYNLTNRSYVAQTRSVYDSKGAAYYICSVIVVYALAIVLLVVSLARRKRKDQYRPANQRSNSEEYYMKIRDLEKSINGARRLSHGRSLNNNLNEMINCSGSSARDMANFKCDWSPNEQVTYSVQSMRQQEINKINPTFKTNSFDSIIKHSEYFKSPKLFCHGSDSKEEIITLVQVISDNAKLSPPITPPFEYVGVKPKLKLQSKSLEETLNVRHHQQQQAGIKKYSSSKSVKNKCRWSMGPDGNIWILQLPDNSSSESEKSHKTAHSERPQRIDIAEHHNKQLTEPNKQLKRPNHFNNYVPSPNNLKADVFLTQPVIHASHQTPQEPLWQYQDNYLEKTKQHQLNKLDISAMFEKYETSPNKHHVKIQNFKSSINASEQYYQEPLLLNFQLTQPKSTDTSYKNDLKSFITIKSGYSNGYVNGTLPNKRENDQNKLPFGDNYGPFKARKPAHCHFTPPKTNIQKLIHVTSV